jgi:hypothetical protein
MIVATLVLAYLAQGSAASELGRGSRLVSACNSFLRIMDSPSGGDPADVPEANYCLGYIEGFTDHMESGAVSTCLGEYTPATVARVYVAYMAKLAKLYDRTQLEGFREALADAYSCRR